MNQKRLRQCPRCGAVHPKILVETMEHRALGCEECLMIYVEGVIQL